MGNVQKPEEANIVIDYKSLLGKYCITVANVEGVHFIKECHVGEPWRTDTPTFTQQEVNELYRLFAEYDTKYS